MDTSAIYFEDFKIGDSHTTYSRTMTETDIVLHADLGDVFPHHMDVEFAKKSEFGQRIAHGALTFSMAVGMKAATINTVGFSYGYDHLRFVTATEAGAICVFYCIFVGVFVYKELKISMIPAMIEECVVSTAGVMIIICAAASFGNYLSWERIPSQLSELLLTLTSNKYVMLLLVNLFLLVVGMFLEGTASLIILTPLLVPTMTALGVDPILFGIIMCVNVTMGGITPPFGTLMFLTCSVIGVSIKDFLKESWPLILTMIIGLLAISYIPPITLLLPNLLG